MVSLAQLAANKANALRSTGPRTVSGKARTRQNALRHGLSAPLSADRASAERIEALADQIGISISAPRAIVWSVAEAQLALIRVEETNTEILNRRAQLLRSPDDEDGTRDSDWTPLGMAELLAKLTAVVRYQRRASSKCKKLLGMLEARTEPQKAREPDANAKLFDHLLDEKKTTYLWRVFNCNQRLNRYPGSQKARENKRRAIVGIARMARAYIVGGMPYAAIRDLDEALVPALAADALPLHAIRSCALLITGQGVAEIFLRYRGKFDGDRSWEAIVQDQARRLRKAPGVEPQFFVEIERLLRA